MRRLTATTVSGRSSSAVIRATPVVVGVFAVLDVAYPLRRPTSLVMIAVFIALALPPLVQFRNRWMPRGCAITIVYIGLLVVPIRLGLVVVSPGCHTGAASRPGRAALCE